MTRTLSILVRCLFPFVGILLLFSSSTKVVSSASFASTNTVSDTLFFTINNCSDEISICLDSLPLTNAVHLSVSVNEQPYPTAFQGCNFDTISAYTYSTLFGQGVSGPYEVTNWTVGDTVFTGVFNTIPDLVDSMNVWNPLGNWVLDTTAKLISGGQNNQTYSNMTVQVLSINTPSFLGYNFGMEANGLQLSFGKGIHNVNIVDTFNNTIRKATVVVACSTKHTFRDSIYTNETASYCFDFSHLETTINFVDFCVPPSQTTIDYTFIHQDSCLRYTGLEPGLDTVCIVICDSYKFCDTTTLYLTVQGRPTPETVYKVLAVGDSLHICPNTSKLSGTATTLTDFCQNKTTETIIFSINNVDLCFEIVGKNEGQDSICAIVCDNFLICDTTFYSITVVPSTSSLIATPDIDTTSKDSPITINILGNDSIPNGILSDVTLLPSIGMLPNGTVVLNAGGTVTYTPNSQFCEGTDIFQYRICNEIECDTTTMQIIVTCAPTVSMKVHTGFSPNGDGLNDFFTIDGISQYPNNELRIFSRWGTKVFEMKGYKNAWDGTWKAQQLPDGTYFYILKDGFGKQYKGFLYIQR